MDKEKKSLNEQMNEKVTVILPKWAIAAASAIALILVIVALD